jgi:acetyl-CoA C-acetyltransferase
VNVHVRSTGVTRFGKRPEPLVQLLAEAGRAALEPVGRKPIDLLVVGTMLAGTLGEGANLVARLSGELGLESSAGFSVEAASATGAAALHAAAQALASGSHRRALVVAGEKMTGRPTADLAARISQVLAPEEVAVGATMPALAALIAQRYLQRHEGSTTAFDRVSVHARSMASHNPNAQFTTPVSAEEVAGSRPVALPLRLLHCSAVTDGAAAVVLERGRGPVELMGLGQSTDLLALVDRPDLTTFQATRVAAQRAFDAAHLTPKAASLVEVHDAFAPFAIIDLEDLGLCRTGEGAGWFTAAGEAPRAPLPVNPSGGILGRGHPVGASGLVQVVELARQLQGEAGGMQVPGPLRAAVAQSIGGMGSHNFVTVLGPGSRP